MNSTQTIPLKVPVGHIMVNSKWSGSGLVKTLQESVPVHFENSQSAIDFYPSCNTGIVYISEADIIEGFGLKKRAARLRRASKVHGIILAEKTLISTQYFHDIQKFCVSDLGLDLIPVRNQTEAAGLLIQLVYADSHLKSNPFMKPVKSASKDPAVLLALMACPGLGSAKSKTLLEKFPSLQAISSATQQELSSVIGNAGGLKLYRFFHDPM
ncbi:Fanconi anemia core complex-associated protein 24 [Bulinus truncatus]|nr:Fanconi anemia core complex-associated protein 24 [Bulinus truncatus]